MSASRQFVVCTLEKTTFAVALASVERVLRAVEITRVPEAPPSILGVIKVKKLVIPVVNVRRRFGLPDRGVRLSDMLVVARVSHGHVALLVDEVTGLITCGDGAIVPAEKILHEMHSIEGVAKTGDGLVIIEDLERFLTDEEAAAVVNSPAAADQ